MWGTHLLNADAILYVHVHATSTYSVSVYTHDRLYKKKYAIQRVNIGDKLSVSRC